jgi:integrase
LASASASGPGTSTPAPPAAARPARPDDARDVHNVRAGQAGVADVYPHSFRHTCAHRWLADGGQERDLVMLAGWRFDDMLSHDVASTAVERAHAAHRASRPAIDDQPVGAQRARSCEWLVG